MDFCYDVGSPFARQGFDRIIYVHGHGSNQMLCYLVARRLVNTTSALAALIAYWALARESVERLRDSKSRAGMSHGCEFETSIYLYLKPEAVKLDKMVVEYPYVNSRFVHTDLSASPPVHFVNRYRRCCPSERGANTKL